MRIAPSMNHEWHLQCITDCTRPAIQKSYWSYKEQSTLIHTPLPLPPSDLLQKVMHCAGHCAVASLLCPRIHIDAMSASVPHRSRHVRRREVLPEPLSINTLLEGAMRHGLGQGACHPHLFWAKATLVVNAQEVLDLTSLHRKPFGLCFFPRCLFGILRHVLQEMWASFKVSRFVDVSGCCPMVS